MRRSGTSDLPLHRGRVPEWLHERMSTLGRAIIECIVLDYGREEVLRRFSDPFWFQSFGAVLGMDWHSSGITTSVMGALKRGLASCSSELGIYICGGRGKHSRRTPQELKLIGDKTGLDGDELARSSRLTAKIDNTAIQDGYQIYLHSFIVSKEGHWTVVQQGMNPRKGYARRYHWHSPSIRSFSEEPHTSIVGINQGQILNLVARAARSTRQGLLDLMHEDPGKVLKEAMHLHMPSHHEVTSSDVDLKRLGAILYAAHHSDHPDFESLLLTQGLGPRTLQSLALVSEVIYGTPIRFSDPARYAFAHGGKDGHPFPVPLKVYDQTISFLNRVVSSAKIEHTDQKQALQKLHEISKTLEKGMKSDPGKFGAYLEWERGQSSHLGGRTVFDNRKENKPNKDQPRSNQLSLF